MTTKRPRNLDQQQLAKFILQNRTVPDGDGCSIYTGCRNPVNGYGVTSLNGVHRYVHRLILATKTGERIEDVPSDRVARHSCAMGGLGCVNPNHLQWGTQAENVADSIAGGTHVGARTECKYGHPLSGINIPNCRKRYCVLCNNANMFRRKLEKRGVPADINLCLARAAYMNPRLADFCGVEPPKTDPIPELSSRQLAHRSTCERGHVRSGANLSPRSECNICALTRARVNYFKRKGITLDRDEEDRKTIVRHPELAPFAAR